MDSRRSNESETEDREKLYNLWHSVHAERRVRNRVTETERGGALFEVECSDTRRGARARRGYEKTEWRPRKLQSPLGLRPMFPRPCAPRSIVAAPSRSQSRHPVRFCRIVDQRNPLDIKLRPKTCLENTIPKSSQTAFSFLQAESNMTVKTKLNRRSELID